MTLSSVHRRGVLGLGAGALTVLLAPAAARAQRPRWPWPDGARGAVSLTYDDGLTSQLVNVAPELERRGWRGTFYITGENIEGREDEWAALARRGHEVENHTSTHPCGLARFGTRSFEARELRPMKALLDTGASDAASATYAYPCGFLGLGRGTRAARFARYQRVVERNFVAARTTAGGPNDPALVRSERYHLHAFEPTYEADVAAPAARYLRQALAQGAWAILVFHDVLPAWRGEGDASIAVHNRILDLIQADGAWCAPVGAVLRHLSI